MEIKDRSPQYPGRVKLTPTGVTNTYDMELADGSTTGAYVPGTPLNKSTFDQFKTDIINEISQNPGLKGAKGDKGDTGLGTSIAKSFLVGTDTTNTGWYEMGYVQLGMSEDYHAKMIVKRTYYWLTTMPCGEINIGIRREPDGIWKEIYWVTQDGVNPQYIKYYVSTTGKVTFYCYIPHQWGFYRFDILCESNRDNYNRLFVPAVSYGGVNTTRIGTSVSGTALSAISTVDSSITVHYFSGATTFNGKTYSSSKTAQWWYTTIGGRVFNYIKLGLGVSGDHWIRIPLGNAVNISCLPFRESTSGYAPGFICWSDANYTYIGLDENNMGGAYIAIVQ